MESPSILLVKEFMHENKGYIASYFITNILTLFIEVIIMSKIMSSIFEKKTADGNLFMWFIICFTFIKAGYNIKSHLYDVILSRFNKFVKTDLFNRIINRFKIDYVDLNPGYVLYNFNNFPNDFNNLLIEFLQEYIPNALGILMCLGALTYLNVGIGIVGIIGLSLIIVTIYSRFSKNLDLSIKEHEIAIGDNEYVNDRVNNLFNIYTNATEKFEIENYDRLETMLEESILTNFTYSTVSVVITSVIAVAIMASIFYLLYRSGGSNGSQIKNMTMIILISTYYSGYLNRIFSNYSNLINILGYKKQADKFLEEITPIEYVRPFHNGNKLNGAIKFVNVNYAYKTDDGSTSLYKGINLNIRKNSKTAIYGKSGSGKTTLVKLLLGFYPVASGKILLNNINVSTIDVDVLRKTIGMLNQNIKLFDGTILDNILYGTGQSKAALMMINTVNGNLLRVFDNLKDKLDTKIQINGSNISGGQKQIINFMRTLLRGSPILILDEPTVGLDAVTKALLLKTIKHMKKSHIRP